MKRLIKILSLIPVFALILGLSACSKFEESIPDAPYVFYLNNSITGLVNESLNTKTPENPTVDECLLDLAAAPLGDGLVAPLEEISVKKYELKDGKLVVDFSREYNNLTGIREVLTRACVVRTLVQCNDVSSVEFTVMGEELTDTNGSIIGAMSQESFVDYFGRAQDSLLSENFAIYYATEDGSGLIRELHRTYFENTLSLERAVIRAMREAPETGRAKCAISQNTNIINITTKDGVCYLDMDMSFYDSNSNISQNMAIMAVVNSLCELNGIRHVELNIIENNEENLNDIPAGNLSGIYEKDMSLVVN